MRTTRIAALAVTVAAAGALGATQLTGHAEGASPAVSTSAVSTPVASATASSSPSTTATTGGTPKLAVGSDGADVTTLQQRLVALGLLHASPNGHYGTATQAAVARFDAEHGLTTTSGVTQQTWDAIAAAARSAASDPSASTTPPTTSTATSNRTPAAIHTPRVTSSSGTHTSASSLDPRCLSGRVLCVSKSAMRLYWVVDGQVQDSWSIRVGMPAHPTREGVFSVYRMEQNSWSNLYHVNMPYAMYFSGGEAVHYSAQFASTGYGDGSHGCVNLRDRAGIAWLYSQVHVGDTVVVYR